jgi:GntR family transcriptional regulator, sialic acid-inducible nan operon repressor
MSATTASTVAPRKKFEEISEHLELLIFAGRLRQGDKLPSERELMAQFGAGRSSVREAIFSLQRKGLVSARAGTPARVTTPTADSLVSELSGAVRHLLARPEGIRDLQNARLLLEVGLARNAAILATDADLMDLKAALEDNRQARDQETFARTDMLFHFALARISHNQIFTALNMALIEWLAEQRNISALSGVTFQDVYVQHEAIYRAIAARDPAAAQDAMEQHLTAVARNYWRQVASLFADDSTPR